MEKSLITFVLLFNDLKYGKNSLYCCNGFNHANFSILFYESQVEELKKAFTKEEKNTKGLMTLLLLFYYFFIT